MEKIVGFKCNDCGHLILNDMQMQNHTKIYKHLRYDRTYHNGSNWAMGKELKKITP